MGIGIVIPTILKQQISIFFVNDMVNMFLTLNNNFINLS